MPHKRAKKSTRDESRRNQGSELAPKGSVSLETEPIPKSIARVLEASKLREAFRKRKREMQDEGAKDGDIQKKRRKDSDQGEALRIQPGESLTHFNRRVEDNMRSKIRTAVQAGHANERKRAIEEKVEKEKRKAENEEHTKGEKAGQNDEQKSKANGKANNGISSDHQPSKRKTEFDVLTTQKPKRLNDIVDAPPDLSALTKKKKFSQGQKSDAFGKSDVISPEQKRMMEIEREKAIKRYRELKQKREGDRPLAMSTIEKGVD